MPGESKIEWTGATWNPVTGCTKVSPGCDHCYAETFAERWRGTPGHAYEQGFDLTLRPERLDWPLRQKKPLTIFVNSMSDLFHADIPEDYIRQVFNTMCCCDGSVIAATGQRSPAHTFQVLTKRAERMGRLATTRRLGYDPSRPPENIWFGVSVESPTYYSRIRHLQRTPAAVRFLSCEPLLAPLPNLPLDGIDWVIVGGESGPGARPMHPDWVRDIRDQCERAGVAFFFKQWGEWSTPGMGEHDPGPALTFKLNPDGPWEVEGQTRRVRRSHTFPDGVRVLRFGKRLSGRHLDGRTYDAMPLRP